MSTSRATVSVVLSFRNEAGNIPTLIARLDAMFAATDVEYELLFVNDASTDDSLAILSRERERNSRVKVLNLSRRFGVAEGVLAGMAWARGDAVIYMDADLQDPPEVVPEMLVRWRGGADVVHTVRTRRRGENALKMLATRTAYRIIQYGSAIELPVDAGDFKLLSRKAVDHLLQLRESDPYLRGLVVWLGFNQAFVPYERDARHAGGTHFPFFSKNPWKTFALGVTSFSFLPIYAFAMLSAVGVLVSLALLVAAAASAGSTGAGRTALAGVITLFWATLVGAIAAIGLYVIRIYKDVRGRPAYLVQSSIGFSQPNVKEPQELTAHPEHVRR
jgi:glycosyltransferase involved in cell wall biosynthesis